LFAFARIRVLSSGQDASVWEKDIEAHQRIVDLVKEGQGEIAERYVQHAMSRFAQNAYNSWEKKSGPSNGTRSRKTMRKESEAPGGAERAPAITGPI
jgi:hypothetical protein